MSVNDTILQHAKQMQDILIYTEEFLSVFSGHQQSIQLQQIPYLNIPKTAFRFKKLENAMRENFRDASMREGNRHLRSLHTDLMGFRSSALQADVHLDDIERTLDNYARNDFNPIHLPRLLRSLFEYEESEDREHSLPIEAAWNCIPLQPNGMRTASDMDVMAVQTLLFQMLENWRMKVEATRAVVDYKTVRTREMDDFLSEVFASMLDPRGTHFREYYDELQSIKRETTQYLGDLNRHLIFCRDVWSYKGGVVPRTVPEPTVPTEVISRLQETMSSIQKRFLDLFAVFLVARVYLLSHPSMCHLTTQTSVPTTVGDIFKKDGDMKRYASQALSRWHNTQLHPYGVLLEKWEDYSDHESVTKTLDAHLPGIGLFKPSRPAKKVYSADEILQYMETVRKSIDASARSRRVYSVDREAIEILRKMFRVVLPDREDAWYNKAMDRLKFIEMRVDIEGIEPSYSVLVDTLFAIWYLLLTKTAKNP